MRHGSLEKNTALAAAAGVFSALAVWFLLKGDAQAPNAVQSFAEARAMVADGAAVAIEYRRTNSPYMRPIVAAMKRWLGADENNGNSQGRRFLALSGLDEADVRWALFSMDAISLTASGELDKMPDWALAVSFPHDLAKIACAYEEVAGDNPPLRLEEAPRRFASEADATGARCLSPRRLTESSCSSLPTNASPLGRSLFTATVRERSLSLASSLRTMRTRSACTSPTRGGCSRR